MNRRVGSAERAPARPTVSVKPVRSGQWAVSLPDEHRELACKTLDEARRLARRCADDRRSCELIIRDAYHRVVHRELVSG